MILRRSPVCRVLLFAALLAGEAGAAGTEIVPISEVRPGMRGVGRTVFVGSRVDGFDVEVIGVWTGMGMGRDLILVRCKGGPLEKTGIVAGMSGSPVYIGKRLLGALSAGWSLAKEPVGGVTPMADMLALLDDKSGKGAVGGDTKAQPGGGASAMAGGMSGGSMAPIATPVYLAGFHPRAIEAFKPKLERFGMVPMIGGAVAATAGPTRPPELEPGSALCAILAEGDMSVSAIGTLTWRQGDRILAFGHAFLDAGPISFPMAPAIVHTVLANYLVSFKIGNAFAPVGALELDFPAGVLGRIGARASMIDTTLSVRRQDDVKAVERRLRIAKHPKLTLEMLALAAASSVMDVTRADGPLTIRSRFAIELETGPVVQVAGAATTAASPTDAILQLLDPLIVLFDNPFRSVMPRSIRMEFETELRNRTATLESIRINKSRFRPGETLEVTASIRPFDGRSIVKTGSIALPRGLETGQAVIEVADARASAAKEKARNPAKYSPKDLSSLVSLLAGTRSETSLWARVSIPREGVSVDGRELPSLPGSVLTVFAGQSVTGTSKLASDLEVEIPTGWVVTGQEALNIDILPEVLR